MLTIIQYNINNAKVLNYCDSANPFLPYYQYYAIILTVGPLTYNSNNRIDMKRP